MRPHRLAFNLTLLLTTATALFGCSVHKDYYATGGSRADGVVDVGYEFESTEQPVADRRQAYEIARTKCSLWGYADAEPFGPPIQTCEARSGFGKCAAYRVSIKYQCLGAPSESQTPVNYLAPTGRPAATPVRAPAPAYAPIAPTNAAPPMGKEEYQQRQLQKLMEENLPYEEYQKRYKAIIGQ